MRRRLDLAASLITRPPLIFLDEPTTGLDPRTRGQMWDTIRDLVADGCTVLLTTQYLDEADQLADRIAVIDRGRKVAEGTPDELKASVGDSTLQLRLADRRRPTSAPRRSSRRVLGERAGRCRPRRAGSTCRCDAATAAVDVLVALREAGVAIDSVSVAEADARRGVPRPHRPRRRRPTTPTTPTTTATELEAVAMTALHRRSRATAAARDSAPRRASRETVSQTLTMAWRALMKMRRNPEQLFDVTLQPLLFTAMFAYIFGGAISGRRAELPAADHPRHRRADRADRLHRHRRPAARGHGQGRLRPLQVAADRPDRAARRPDGRRPAALRDRRDPHLR